MLKGVKTFSEMETLYPAPMLQKNTLLVLVLVAQRSSLFKAHATDLFDLKNWQADIDLTFYVTQVRM